MHSLGFIITNGLLLGLGLSMDAFAVSVANGLNEPDMQLRRSVLIAGTFAVFQTLMPLLGWVLVQSLGRLFSWLQPLIPWIALALLTYIGIKMILDGVHQKGGEEAKQFTLGLLVLQAVATSIDALSVGFTTAELGFMEALLESLIIGAVTLLDCFLGVRIGKHFGMKISYRASIVGGCVLILVGMEILITSFFS